MKIEFILQKKKKRKKKRILINTKYIVFDFDFK